MESRKRTHVAMVPSPGMGHVIPMAELAKLLLRAHNISTTLVVPTDSPPSEAMKSVLSSLPPEITHQFLPQVSFDDLPANTKIETRITLTVARSLPHLRSAVQSLAGDPNLRLAAVVVDLFATDALDLAAELSLSGHVFYPSTATTLSLFLHLPQLDAAVPSGEEFRNLSEPVTLPGVLPIPGSELLDPLQDRRDDAYRWTLHNASRYVLADSIILNSFLELEPHAVGTLLQRESPPRVFPVGPLINKDPVASDPFACLPWLDSQPPGSVLFVSFGSGGTLSSAQVAELAAGLEKSDQRFLWVVRRPNDAVANATYFSVGTGDSKSPLDFLPEGFLARTGGRGKVVYSWAPQAQILGHAATGGFLTHCGWNSTLESVACGVPLIAWPLFAEQKMNAFMLTREAKVAMRPLRSAATGLVEAGEVARVAKALIEGEEGKALRGKMRELKDAASVALSPDGASTKALASLARQWNDRGNKTVV